MSIISVREDHIRRTISELAAAGKRNCEYVVLWVGKREGQRIEIIDFLVPEQIVRADAFRIPRQGMNQIFAHLRETRGFLAAQVHSHPELAFHSSADDEWAIVRHVGALSIVVPYFGDGITRESFSDMTALYRLDSQNRWVLIEPDDASKYYVITP